MENLFEKAKRGRKPTIVDKKEDSKMRSRIHRQHKKEHIDWLENRVNELEQELKEAKNKVSHYHSILQMHGISEDGNKIWAKVISNDSYTLNELPKLIKNSPEMVKGSTHLLLWETSNDSRKEFIKESFKTLFDYIFPTPLKIWNLIQREVESETYKIFKSYPNLSNIK